MKVGAEGLKSRDQHSDVPITHRKQASQEPAATWLDGLLLALCDVDPSGTIEQAAQTIVDAASEMMQDVAIGVCIPEHHSGGQIVYRRSPRLNLTQSPDPARLFPEFRTERRIAICFDENATLHF